MNTVMLVNVGILATMIFFIVSGYTRGFVLKLLGIVSFFVIGFLSWHIAGVLSNVISLYPLDSTQPITSIVENVVYDSFNQIVIFVILFVIFQLIMMVLRPALYVFQHIPVVSTLNRIAGCLLGGIQGILMLCLVALVLQLPFWTQGRDIVNASYLRYYKPIANVVLFYTKDSMTQLQALQDGMDDKKAFTAEEISNIRTWLLQNNIEKESVDDILRHLRVK